MKRSMRPRGPRIGRSKRGHQDSRLDHLHTVYELDTTEGITGVLHQMSQVVCKPSNNSKLKDICLVYINNTVNYLVENSNKIDSRDSNTRVTVTDKNGDDVHCKKGLAEDWNDHRIKEKYFCLFRCILLHKRKEVRVAGLRLIRYVIRTEEDVNSLIKSGCIPLIVRCIDLCIDNHNERIHGIRLARHMMHVAPFLFPKDLARCLIAIAKDGSRERDKLLRSAQAIINELAILNPEVFVDCGGIASTLYGILDCSFSRINEALMSSLLFLLNDPNWRSVCSQFHMIMAPFSDVHYRHHEYDIEYSKSEERELRIQSSCYALLAAFRSWPGFITLYQPHDRTLDSLIELLRLPGESTREVILDFLYDLFRIQMSSSYTDYEKVIQERTTIKPPDSDAWKLHEGFVVAEAKVLLPHVARFRPNLIQNYFSLLLYTMVIKGLLTSLCEVIITASQSVSIKAAILLGELLHIVDQNLPECGMMLHALPILSEKAAGSDGEQRLKASQAISALLQLSRMRLKREIVGMSLYLSSTLEINEYSKTIGSSERPKFSKWLGRDHDDLIQHTLKNSGIFASKYPSTDWNWSSIIPLLKWPSPALLSLEDSVYRSFIEKLVHYFKPSSELFSRVESTHSTAIMQAETLVAFVEFLLEVSEEDQGKFLSDFLNDINSLLKEVACEMPYHDSYLSPSHLSITVCQYYFLAIGRLTRHPKGYTQVQKAGIYDQMLIVISKSVSDVYAKLFATTLDYSINGLNRTILSKILTCTKECSRMYTTQFLRVLVRSQAKDFTKWGIELLVGQLYDKSKLIALVAVDILDEAMDNEEYLEAILKNPPSVQHLGDSGQLLLAKLVASPQGFKTYYECNFINALLDKWANSFNIKYVQLMEMALSEALTHLQKGEDGLYGRRTGNKHVVHDVFVLPHLYGSLALHKDGFTVLINHESLAQQIEIVKEANISNLQERYKLKAAIWALGHLGKSTIGVNFLNSENLIFCLLNLASSCTVYSVRGTIFHAICLIATTWEGANILQKLGWESVRRHHHEHLQSCPVQEENIDDLLQPPKRAPNHPSESDADDAEKYKAGFYFMDETDDDTDSISLTIDDLDVESAATRKSQTLPHDTKPPSYMGHQRSLSDVPVIEELSTASPYQPALESISSKRTTRLKNKILSSFRRKSSKRRDSVGSRTSNSSSASEKMFSFLHPSRRRRNRQQSYGSSGRGEDEFDSAHSHSSADDRNLTEDSDDLEGTPRISKLSPIASGASLIGVDISEEPSRKILHVSGEKRAFPILSSPHHSSIPSYGFPKIRPRRGVSESSHDELQSKNSLRDFLSSSYDPNTHRGMARSPSGCSELSSVRSSGTLAVRGGSSNWLVNRREGSNYPYTDEDPGLHPSGQCYMGLALPVDTDKLLLDTSALKEKTNEECTFSAITDAVCENPNYGWRDRKTMIAEALMVELSEDCGLEFHKAEKCLRCYSYLTGEEDAERKDTDSTEEIDAESETDRPWAESPTLRRLHENNRANMNAGLHSEVSESTAESCNCQEDRGKRPRKRTLKDRYLVRTEILRFVSNLSTSFIAKSSEAGLLALKTTYSWGFQDPCLYAEVCVLLSSYCFRLNARRFIQELFLDLAFKEVFEDARRILHADESLYQKQNEKLKSIDDVIHDVIGQSSDVTRHDIPEYNINDFEGFDMADS